MNSTPQDRFDEWWNDEHPKGTPTWEIDIDSDTKEDEITWDETQT